MHKKAGLANTIFMFLVLIAIIVAIVMLLNGSIELPVETGLEQKVTCEKTCESLGRGIITNATGQDDCEAMDGKFIEDLEGTDILVCCCA